jgi:very-short-patch-repair endonuclease
MGVGGVLERQQVARARGEAVLSVVVGDSPHAWGAWAASHGCLSLLLDDHERAIPSLLAQFPWVRTIVPARARFATACCLADAEIDAALDARGDQERWRWICDQVGHDEHALVSGWMLASLRTPHPPVAPVSDARLLQVACDLAAPIAIAFHHHAPTKAWCDGAIATAAGLVARLPRHPIAVVAPQALVHEALEASFASHSMARQGLVDVPEVREAQPRSRAERELYEALGRDRRTMGRFELNQRLSLDIEREVDLLEKRARIAVEIDGWFHFREPDSYRRDRRKDVVLQQAGYLVVRYLAEDVTERLELVVDEIARVLAARGGVR